MSKPDLINALYKKYIGNTVFCIRPKVITTVPLVATKEIVKGRISDIKLSLMYSLAAQLNNYRIAPLLEQLSFYVSLENGEIISFWGNKYQVNCYKTRKEAQKALEKVLNVRT